VPPAPAPGGFSYEPGEREASFTSPGGVEKTSSGLVLFNFGVNKTFIKPEHQQALIDLIKTLHLDDPNAEKTIIKVSGFTDGVDTEPKNSPLRANRADAVQIFLQGKGATEENVGTIVNTPAGNFLAPNTTREGRARNRAVVIELGSMHIDPVPDPVKPTPKSTKSKKWALQGNLSLTPPLKPGVVVTTVNFILTDRENNKKFLLQFGGFGGGFGVGFLANVAIPSPTNFETAVPVDVDEFNGGGAIRQANVGLVIGFSFADATLHPKTDPPQIDIGGLQFSFGVDASVVGGQWKILG
jgi:outer membrane protein OmpA-like peptidoglycan-associated protein